MECLQIIPSVVRLFRNRPSVYVPINKGYVPGSGVVMDDILLLWMFLPIPKGKSTPFKGQSGVGFRPSIHGQRYHYGPIDLARAIDVLERTTPGPKRRRMTVSKNKENKKQKRIAWRGVFTLRKNPRSTIRMYVCMYVP